MNVLSNPAAFDYLLRQLPDLVLDAPDAPVVLGNFMARAIADDCIPPKFLQNFKGHVESDAAKDAGCKRSFREHRSGVLRA